MGFIGINHQRHWLKMWRRLQTLTRVLAAKAAQCAVLRAASVTPHALEISTSGEVKSSK